MRGVKILICSLGSGGKMILFKLIKLLFMIPNAFGLCLNRMDLENCVLASNEAIFPLGKEELHLNVDVTKQENVALKLFPRNAPTCGMFRQNGAIDDVAAKKIQDFRLQRKFLWLTFDSKVEYEDFLSESAMGGAVTYNFDTIFEVNQNGTLSE